MQILKNYSVKITILILFASLTGCNHISVGPINMPVPVLITPVERIDDNNHYRAERVSKDSFKGKASITYMGSGGSSQHREGNYIVTETTSAGARMSNNNVASSIRTAWYNSGSKKDDIIYIDDVRACAWMQTYIFLMVGGINQKVKGEVTGRP